MKGVMIRDVQYVKRQMYIAYHGSRITKIMSQITIEHNPSQDRLHELGVFNWPVWSREASEFPWYYDEQEICYLLEGSVVVTPDEGEPVEFQQGDLVTFPKGMSCTWKINKEVRKHYRFG